MPQTSLLSTCFRSRLQLAAGQWNWVQFRQVYKFDAIAKYQSAGAKDHCAPEHHKQQTLRVVLMRKDARRAEHRHGEQKHGGELKRDFDIFLVSFA